MVIYEQTALFQQTQNNVHIVKASRLPSLLKWAGGKEQELKYIRPLIPRFHNYYEPFVGGGAVFFSITSENKFINDKSSELINFYTMVAESNQDFLNALNVLLDSWQCISKLVDDHSVDLINIYKTYSNDTCSLNDMKNNIFDCIHHHIGNLEKVLSTFLVNDAENYIRETQRNLLNKTKRMKELENKKGKLIEQDILANIESALKSAFYMHLRHLNNKLEEYNISPSLAAAIFFFVRENAYASMFRYNSQGEFNVPYGGISYNRKDLARKIAYMQSPKLLRHLHNTVIKNMDFEDFLHMYPPQEDDFIFLDPPYDSEFSTYAQNEFGGKDQERLANYLTNECKAKFMLVIKNTNTIFNLYNKKNLNIRTFSKKYLVSFQDRNNRDAEHLLITNF